MMGKLMQQFIIAAFLAWEENSMNFYRNHQSRLRRAPFQQVRETSPNTASNQIGVQRVIIYLFIARFTADMFICLFCQTFIIP